jgi:lipopolysaccharide transport system permease protein
MSEPRVPAPANTVPEDTAPCAQGMTVVVYTPESSLANPRNMARHMLRDLRAARELSWRLAVRDISAQYRQTLLGFFWAVALPLANTLIWVFLNRSGLVEIGRMSEPYAAFVFVGTMLWAILMDAVNAPLQGVTTSKDMLAKINFPREAIVVAGVYQVAFNATIKLGLILAGLACFSILPDWHLLLVPVGVASLVLAGTVVGLLITPVGVLYSDVGKGVPLLMQFAMYLTPIVYPMPQEGGMATLVMLNPLTALIETTRGWLMGEATELLCFFVGVNVVATAMLIVLWAVYRLAMPILIERMSA